MNPKSQKERVLAMLRTHGKYGVRSDRFLEVGIPRAAARIWELRGEGHEISGEREKQFVRYYLANSAGVGAGSSSMRQGSVSWGSEARSRPSASVDPGGDKPTAGVGGVNAGGLSPIGPSASGHSPDPGGDSPGGFSGSSALGEPARQPQTGREREGREIEKSLERQDAYWRRVGGHPSPPQPPTDALHLFDPAEARARPLNAFTDSESEWAA